jgi:3-oxoacyl-[acyl-carrier-protein] synthase II
MLSNGAPRVVISGIGVVSPFGVGREPFWNHISHGCSGTRRITQFDVSTYPCQIAAWVPPVSIDDAAVVDGDDDQDGRADPKRYSRAALFGVIAGREAWNDAGLRAGESKAGVLIGSGGGGIDDCHWHLRDGVERDLDLARIAWHQPRPVVRLHLLNRCDRVCGGADPGRGV